jgi:hypothetical protein
MALILSNVATGNGIIEQVRDLTRTDATRWPSQKIINSSNNYKYLLTGEALFKDDRFQWDDSNQGDLPIGITDLVAGQSDYSYTTDQTGNQIITLLRAEVKDASGNWHELKIKDLKDIRGAVSEYKSTAGIPEEYDKVADNSLRLFPVSSANVTGGLKLFFQRTPKDFVIGTLTDTTGFSALLDRGFIINAAYDCALSLGLGNIQALSVERELEAQKRERYFSVRNKDESRSMRPAVENNR